MAPFGGSSLFEEAALGQGQKSMGKRQGQSRRQPDEQRQAAFAAVRRAARNGIRAKVLHVDGRTVTLEVTQTRGAMPKVGDELLAITANDPPR